MLTHLKFIILCEARVLEGTRRNVSVPLVAGHPPCQCHCSTLPTKDLINRSLSGRRLTRRTIRQAFATYAAGDVVPGLRNVRLSQPCC